MFTGAYLQLINKGKGEALRIRAILRSLVPTKDLVGIISIPLKMPVVNKGLYISLDVFEGICFSSSRRRKFLFFHCLS